jgi:two-component system response regulator
MAILLVEDNLDDELLARRALVRAGVTEAVTVARDGAGALGILHGHPGEAGAARPGTARAQPRLVLLDVKLPGMNGLEVLRRIRADRRTQFVPVVMLTGSREQEDVLASYQNGANAYVRKPLKLADLVTALRVLDVFWLKLNEPPPDEVP